MKKDRYTLDEIRGFLLSVIVKRVTALLLFCLLFLAFNEKAGAFQVDRYETVSGVVTDASNDESLPGVHMVNNSGQSGSVTGSFQEMHFLYPILQQ